MKRSKLSFLMIASLIFFLTTAFYPAYAFGSNKPKGQVIGVFRKDLAEVMARAAKQVGPRTALIFWNAAGLDELTSSHRALVYRLHRRKLSTFWFDPKTLHLKRGPVASLRGGNPRRNRRLALGILRGKDKSVRRDVVLLNAAAILMVSGRCSTFKKGLALAAQSIHSGAALQTLQHVIRLSHDPR